MTHNSFRSILKIQLILILSISIYGMCLLLGGLGALSESGCDHDSDEGVDMKDGQHGSNNRTLNNASRLLYCYLYLYT
jgi:hypothetical protein